MDEPKILVEVAYATAGEQLLRKCLVSEGTTVEAAIRQSGLLESFPEIDLDKQTVGIFSKPCKLERIVNPGDRIEIYRPLLADPKTLRRLRAQKPNLKTTG